MTLHHVGYVVRSIREATSGFVSSLDLVWDGRVIHDREQTVKVSFLYPRATGQVIVELVEPAGDGSKVHRFLEQGGGLHHLCYEVDSLDDQLAKSKADGDLVVRSPTPAIAFDGRQIAWVYTRNRLLVEFLERARA